MAKNNMFSKKLNGLQYDQPFDIEVENDYRSLVYWLENMKIRFYPPEGRNVFLLDTDPSAWTTAFHKYLNEIGYSGPLDNKKRIVDFLLTLALQYDMEDTRSQLNISKQQISDLSKVNIDLSRVDVNSKEFIDGLRQLSSRLNVPFYQDEPLITLHAIAILLRRQQKLSLKGGGGGGCGSGAQQTNATPAPSSPHYKKKKFSSSIDEEILEQPFSDNVKHDFPPLNRAANVLRLLYIKDLRNLQTQINSMIVQVQSLTANPKTDTTLGKVGR